MFRFMKRLIHNCFGVYRMFHLLETSSNFYYYKLYYMSDLKTTFYVIIYSYLIGLQDIYVC